MSRGAPIFLLLVSLSAAACAPNEQPAQQSAAQATGSAEASLMQLSNEPNLPPNAKSQPRELMTRFLAQWSGTVDPALGVIEERRECVDRTRSGCGLEVSPRPDLGAFGPRDYSANGRLLARLRNVGSKTEKQFDLAPGDSLFLFVTPDSADSRYSFIARRALAYYPTSHRWEERRYLECPPHAPDADKILAKFRSCPFPLADKAKFAEWQPGGPLWFKCSDGCCTVT